MKTEMPHSSLSFLCDERIQALSAQAESFLNRLRELFARYPMALDEHGRAPADPAQLRNLTYPHRPDIRHTYVARWFLELEAASLLTVHETGQGRSFELARDALAALPPPEHVNTAPAREVIHISRHSGADPPSKIIADAAATAVSSSDLIEKLRPHFPRHDLLDEWRRYKLRRKKDGQPVIAVSKNPRCLSFVKWMEKADPPVAIAKAFDPLAGQTELDFTEPADPKFMAEFESRKLRKAAG